MKERDVPQHLQDKIGEMYDNTCKKGYENAIGEICELGSGNEPVTEDIVKKLLWEFNSWVSMMAGEDDNLYDEYHMFAIYKDGKFKFETGIIIENNIDRYNQIPPDDKEENGKR